MQYRMFARSGVPLNGKQGNCGHSCDFLRKSACWGQPQTRYHFGPNWLEVVASLCSFYVHTLPLLFLTFLLLGRTQQSVNICFDRQDLLHGRPSRPVLFVGGLFLCGKLLPLGFQFIHLG